MTFSSKEISVIVQGAIDRTETFNCLKSIRKFLPEAEIILSTWNGEDVSELDYDILVQNDAPIALVIEKTKNKTVYNNMNRQLLSIQAGLKRVTRKYTLKLRSDLILTGDNFLEYFDKFQNRIDGYKLFERKILVPALFTRDSLYYRNKQKNFFIPFHVSDWWFFGLTNDLETYFMDTPLVELQDFNEYFDLEKNKGKQNPYLFGKFKFSPEQYFCYSCFQRKFADIYMEDAADYSDALMEKSRKCLINNFIVLEFEHSGIYMKKYPFSKYEKFLGEQYIGLYNFHRFESEYKKYCDVNYAITTHGLLFNNEKQGYELARVYKHIGMLKGEDTSVLQKIEQLFIGLPVSLVKYFISIIKEKLLKS